MLVLPASAGDRALLNVIGYSEDARYFAFEEYGLHDGSGFAYSTIYVVDLPADKWAGGSPFRAEASDETDVQPFAEVRTEAMTKARAALLSAGVTAPAEILWLDGTAEGDGKSVAFSYGPILSEGNYLSVKLATAPAQSSLDCVTLTGKQALGFTLRAAADEGTGTLRHDDAGKIPASRGCSTDYRIYAVVRPADALAHLVAIIASYPFGFEGPDRRFLVVPIDK
ncbi:MAG: DUF2259 domain-containing protein [Devosia sp.]